MPLIPQLLARLLGTGWCEKKAPSPPNAKLNRLRGFSKKTSGAFFSHRHPRGNTSTLESRGNGGGLFFRTDRSRGCYLSCNMWWNMCYCNARGGLISSVGSQRLISISDEPRGMYVPFFICLVLVSLPHVVYRMRDAGGDLRG